MVLVHGFSASADDPDLESVADVMHSRGFDVVSYDSRGHGASEGESTLGDLEQHDVAAAVEIARCRTEQVVLVGASMGAIAALRYAAGDDALHGVVSVSCPARWKLPLNPMGLLMAGMTRTGVGRALLGRLLQVRVAQEWTDPEPPADLVERIAVPVAFVHGTADRFISALDAAELYAGKSEPRRLDLVRDMGHAYDPSGVVTIAEAVEWTLSSEVTQSA